MSPGCGGDDQCALSVLVWQSSAAVAAALGAAAVNPAAVHAFGEHQLQEIAQLHVLKVKLNVRVRVGFDCMITMEAMLAQESDG
eukprot:3044954-Amphidinium_carterae.3